MLKRGQPFLSLLFCISEETLAQSRVETLDIMAQQLKFMACLKVSYLSMFKSINKRSNLVIFYICHHFLAESHCLLHLVAVLRVNLFNHCIPVWECVFWFTSKGL